MTYSSVAEEENKQKKRNVTTLGTETVAPIGCSSVKIYPLPLLFAFSFPDWCFPSPLSSLPLSDTFNQSIYFITLT